MLENKTEYGLTVAGVTALSSKELSIELFNIMESIRQGNKSAWEIAHAYARIVEEELFDEDFDTLKEFAEYVGVSPATITQYCKAVAFIDGQPDMNEDTFSVGTAYLLSTLGENLGDFVAWLESQDINLATLSVAGLKELMKKYKHKDEVAEESEETEESAESQNEVEDADKDEVAEESEETEESAESQNEVEDAEVEEIDKEGLILMILNTMAENNITIEDLQAHME